jgi:PAS domain S-box-containing protein
MKRNNNMIKANKILIVDNEQNVLNVFKKAFQHLNIDTATARNKTEAKEKFKSFFPGVMFIDLHLGNNERGEDLVREIREINPNVIFVLMTGYPGIDSAKSAINLNAFAYLSKPFNVDEIVFTAKKSIDKYKEDVKTRRRKLALIKSGDRYRKIIDSHKIIYVRVNMSNEITFVNNAYCNTFGVFKKDILGKVHVPEVHPNDIKETKRQIKDLFSAPGYSSRMTQRTMTPLGWRWIYWEDSMILNENGRPVEVQAVGRDITEDKQRESFLTETLKNLEASNRDLENFAYVASHDLQEPLRKITSFIDLANEDMEKERVLTKQGEFYLSRVTSSAVRMKNLIEDLLDYSRISSRGEQFTLLDIEEIIEKIIDDDLDDKVKKSGAKIKIGTLPKVLGDRKQVKQMFINFISNAIKFRKKNNELLIGIRCKKAEEENRRILLVEDNGIGFDEKHKDLIWQTFQKLHSKDEYPGSGIGLAICKRIAERHGWTVSSSSVSGGGSTFYIGIPLKIEGAIHGEDCCSYC